MRSNSKIHQVFTEGVYIDLFETLLIQVIIVVILDKLGHVVGAQFNHEDRPGCMPGTRVLLLADLLRWATDKKSPHVFWLSGMAGTGKTTATETFCMILRQKNILGTSFFCSNKASDRSNIRNVLPSLAKSLASMNSAFRRELVKRLEHIDPLGMNIADQYQKLILEPAELTLNRDKIIVLVIDALDECAYRQAVKLLLDAILVSKPRIMLKFFVTSRPEPIICNTFAEKNRHSVLYLHDIESHIVEADIALYLKTQLAEIPGLKHHYGNSWPPPEIDVLVSRVGNLFIYASTIYQYIADDSWDSYDSFQNICKLEDSGTESANIDALYTFILTEAFKGRSKKQILVINACISLLLVACSPLPMSTYSKLLNEPLSVVTKAFGLLHAVIKVPEVNSHDKEVSIYHASFSDYLIARSQDYQWAVDIIAANNNAANYCFNVLNTELHFGISKMKTSFKSNIEQTVIPIPNHLAYACSAWVDHVLLSTESKSVNVDLLKQLDNFLDHKLLFWLEAQSVSGKIGYCAKMFFDLSKVCRVI